MSRVALSGLKPDASIFNAQLTQILSSNPTWQAIYSSALGQTLIDWFSGIGEYEQAAIQQALQETALDTARQDDSIIVLARMLGAHIQRKVPGAVVCLLNTSVNTVVPAYTIFNAGTITLFNRYDIVLTAGIAQSVVLYEGRVVSEDFLSSGGAFQRFYLGTSGNNVISDLDLFAHSVTNVVGSNKFVSNQTGLWDATPGQQVFYENTLANGTIEVLFGNDTYGAAPLINSIIAFTYVITAGKAGNNSTTGIVVSVSNNSSVTGVTTTFIADGQDQKGAAFYKYFTPFIYSARGRAVTRDDFKALALTYTGQDITDISFLGQKDVAPNDPAWINLVQYSLLSASSSFNRPAFERWLSSFCMFQTNFYYVEPTTIPVSVSVAVYCQTEANLNSIKESVRASIIEFFTPVIGSIGKNMYIGDLYQQIEASDPSILYIQLNTPTASVIINTFGQINPPQQYVTLALISGVPDITVATYYRANSVTAGSPNDNVLLDSTGGELADDTGNYLSS